MLRAALNRGVFSNFKLLPPVKCSSRNLVTGSPSNKTLTIGLASLATVALSSAGALFFQYRSNIKKEEEIASLKVLMDGKMREYKSLQRQLAESRQLAEENAIKKEEKATGTDELSEGQNKPKLEGDQLKNSDAVTNTVNEIDTKIDEDFQVSLEKKYQKMLKKYRENLEEELRHHLKRQLAAHNDHLQEQLQLLNNELERKNQIHLEDALIQERIRYQQELTNSMCRLQAIENILKIRDKLDQEERLAKELWLACQTLKDILKYSHSKLNEDVEPKKMTSELKTLKQALNEFPEKNILATVALESISQEAIDKGVYSEDDLINRFSKVERICKRVALIGDGESNLFKYLLSYVQSFLIFNDPKIPQEELNGQEIDPTEWDTFDILNRVKFSLNKNNLEMALRYANQLKGQPRKVAKDWIKDARAHLEVKQVVDIILNQAASIGAQVLQ